MAAARWRTAAGVAVALVLLGAQAATAAEDETTPREALILVRQALAALEVGPPDIGVATQRTIKALLAPDTRGVDMPRLRDAAQALGEEDAAAAAMYLMEALRPSEAGPSAIDPALLVPVTRRFVASPAAYALLAGAVLLIAAGTAVVRR